MISRRQNEEMGTFDGAQARTFDEGRDTGVRRHVSVWGYDPSYERIETYDYAGNMVAPVQFRRCPAAGPEPTLSFVVPPEAMSRFLWWHAAAFAINLLLSLSLALAARL